jgi:hypothetical protein
LFERTQKIIDVIAMPNEEIYLYEVMLREDDSIPCLYVIVPVSDDRDRFLTSEKRIFVTDNIEEASQVIKIYLGKTIPIEEIAIIGSFLGDAIDFLHSSETQLENAWLLDTFNFLSDLCYTLEIDTDNYFRETIDSFADFLTFDKNIANFKDYSKKELINALYWGMGLFVSNIRI